jgi:hypothetical protein
VTATAKYCSEGCRKAVARKRQEPAIRDARNARRRESRRLAKLNGRATNPNGYDDAPNGSAADDRPETAGMREALSLIRLGLALVQNAVSLLGQPGKRRPGDGSASFRYRVLTVSGTTVYGDSHDQGMRQLHRLL